MCDRVCVCDDRVCVCVCVMIVCVCVFVYVRESVHQFDYSDVNVKRSTRPSV